MDATIEGALRRDRWIVVAGLVAVAAASWAYLLAGAGMDMDMGASDAMSMPGMDDQMAGMAMTPAAWTPHYAVVMFLMWWIMMIAMMLPGATPMILLFAAVNRRQRERGNPFVTTTLFTASYLVAWAGFSLLAVILHWMLQRTGLLSPDMALTSQFIGAGLLVAAGLYQITPIKQACLRHCRSPAAYLAEHWRRGTGGAVVMGLQHGAYCLGCCWFLMLLLFFGGVMNLVWIAGLALYVLVEKAIPAGHWLDYGVGAVLVAAGGLLMAAALAGG